MTDREHRIDTGSPEEEEPECTCEQVDVDLYDNRYCEAHGPSSYLAKRNRQAEAEAEAAFWRGMPEF